MSVLMTCLKNFFDDMSKEFFCKSRLRERWWAHQVGGGGAGESEWLNARGKHLLSEGFYDQWILVLTLSTTIYEAFQ